MRRSMRLHQWYVNTYISGEPELVAQANAQSSNICSGGYMVLLQEQDSFSKYSFSYLSSNSNQIIYYFYNFGASSYLGTHQF